VNGLNVYLSKPLPYHWERVVHLFSNRLILGFADEVYLSLAQASGYIPHFAGSSGNAAIQQIQAVQVSIGTAPTLQSSLAESVKKSSKGTSDSHETYMTKPKGS
jgi:hypothetical protein